MPATPTTSLISTCVTRRSTSRAAARLATLTVFRFGPALGRRGRRTRSTTGRVVGFVEKPRYPRSDLVNAGMYAFSPSVLDEVDGPPPLGHRLSPAAAPRRPRVGGGRRRVLPRHRHSGGISAGSDGVAGEGTAMIITQTPLRIGLLGGGTDLPEYYREHGGRVAELRDRQVRLRDREAAIRRRHLRQLLEEGDRVVRCGHRARARPRGDVDDRCRPRRRDHDAGRHSLGGFGSRLVVGGDRRAAATRCSRTPGVRSRAKSWPNGPARSRSNGAASRSVSRINTSPRSAASATSGSARERASSPRRSAFRRSTGVPSRSRSCCSTRVSPEARTRFSLSSGRTSGRRCAQLDRLRDLAGVAVEALCDGRHRRGRHRAARELGREAQARGRASRTVSIDLAVARDARRGRNRREGDRRRGRRLPARRVSDRVPAPRCAERWPTSASCRSSSIGSVSRVVLNVVRDIWG